MRSDTAIAALRDLAHHIDLAESFTTGFDYETFVADPPWMKPHQSAFPAQAGIHRSACRALEEWAPASAGAAF